MRMCYLQGRVWLCALATVITLCATSAWAQNNDNFDPLNNTEDEFENNTGNNFENNTENEFENNTVNNGNFENEEEFENFALNTNENTFNGGNNQGFENSEAGPAAENGTGQNEINNSLDKAFMDANSSANSGVNNSLVDLAPPVNSNPAVDPLASLNATSPVLPADPLTSSTALPPPPQTSGASFEPYDPSLRQFNEGLKRELQQRLEADLRTYCFEYCSVLSLQVSSGEVFDAVNPDLGFDDTTQQNRTFSAERVSADVLVDVRYGSKNVERLKQLIAKLSTTYPYPIDVVYTLIEMPNSDATAKGLAEVKAQFVRRITAELERLVRDFCPDECRASDVQVQVEQASIDDLAAGAQNRYIHARGARGAIFVKGVSASLSLNNEMPAERRRRLESLFREVLQPFGEVNLSLKLMNFPISASQLERERDDPYGLDRLRKMLEIFKEFAGTKEIIKESQSATESLQNSTSEMSQSIKERTSDVSSSSSRESSSAQSSSEERSRWSESQGGGFLGMSEERLYLLGGFVLVALLLAIFGLRYILSTRRVQHVVREGMTGSPEPMSLAPEGFDNTDGQTLATHAGRPGISVTAARPVVTALPMASASESNADLVRTLAIQRLKDELMQIFVRQPKVAREVFGRIIREDGVQQAAKCVAVFGELVTFELLDDSELKESLATLAEYVHRNVPHVDAAEELQLLESLKLRVAAGKIRVMTDKGFGSFEFLKAKAPRQIYNLIADESAQSQSVVLTQLSKAKRNAVFDLFEGEAKIELLRALCQGRVVANEYLLSLADALRRKAQRSGIFDQGLTSGVDVLLDLMAQSSLSDQQVLMAELDGTNPEAARMVRSSLVTPETLQFIRDGLLIEIFLGMEQQILATFLAGCPDHIRNMVLSKVPQDMAQDWYDLMNSMPSMDSETYKVAELQIMQKIRSFSDSGMISLLEINQSIFPEQRSAEVAAVRGQRRFRISQHVVA